MTDDSNPTPKSSGTTDREAAWQIPSQQEEFLAHVRQNSWDSEDEVPLSEIDAFLTSNAKRAGEFFLPYDSAREFVQAASLGFHLSKRSTKSWSVERAVTAHRTSTLPTVDELAALLLDGYQKLDGVDCLPRDDLRTWQGLAEERMPAFARLLRIRVAAILAGLFKNIESKDFSKIDRIRCVDVWVDEKVDPWGIVQIPAVVEPDDPPPVEGWDHIWMLV
ncbi:MAG: hypothetical protein NTW86_06080 [Candidatus Sumerlaeota bacterium]|nr:hypothetical protein [Candidatus Sumerlaeota bacterium]